MSTDAAETGRLQPLLAQLGGDLEALGGGKAPEEGCRIRSC